MPTTVGSGAAALEVLDDLLEQSDARLVHLVDVTKLAGAATPNSRDGRGSGTP